MKNFPIDKFGTKLMASSRSVNKIPYEYLSYSQNLRIYDGGIGVRRGFTSAYEGGQGINNGGFVLNGNFYQIESGKIYKIDTIEKTRVEVEDLGYNARCDVLVYQKTKGNFTSLATQSITWDSSANGIVNYWTNYNNTHIYGPKYSNTTGDINYDELLGTDITGYAIPAIKFLQTGTTTFRKFSSGAIVESDGIIVTEGQFVYNEGSSTSGAFDIQVGYFSQSETAIITSNGQNVQVFDGISLSTVSIANTGIIEFLGGRSFLSSNNVLLASRPVSLLNPEYAYDWTGTNSYQIVYDSDIVGLKSTLGGLYVFTNNKVEYISAGNSVSGLSIPIGVGGTVINPFSIVASGEKIFYLTKNLEIETINYISGTSDAQIGRLSSQKVINIREYLQNLNSDQSSAFAYNNRDEQNIQFFLRSNESLYNDVCVVYDLVNDTWNIDTGKYYCDVVEYNNRYYGLSNVNASLYLDGEGYTDDGVKIDSVGETQNMNLRSPNHKLFGGFYTAGAIGQLSGIRYEAEIDENNVFNQKIQGQNIISNAGIGDAPIGDTPVGGKTFEEITNPFNIEANEGRIWQYGDRIKIRFSGDGIVQNFLIDTLGIKFEPTQVTLINNTF